MAPEVKLLIIRAVAQAKRAGFTVARACEVIMLSPRRLRRWCAGRDPGGLAAADVVDRPPVAKVRPHALRPAERAEITKAALEDDKAHLRHRKLAHTLSREQRVFCSESSVLRVLRAEALVPAYRRTPKPKRAKPEVAAGEPNQSWRYDFTRVPTRAGTWYLLPILDACSKKIVGWSFEPRETAAMLERLYLLDTGAMSPYEVESEITAFIEDYNTVRLHQGIGFVTPAERHDGRHEAIIEARRRGMQTARAARMAENRRGRPGSTLPVKTRLRGSERAGSKGSRRKKVIGPCS